MLAKHKSWVQFPLSAPNAYNKNKCGCGVIGSIIGFQPIGERSSLFARSNKK